MRFGNSDPAVGQTALFLKKVELILPNETALLYLVLRTASRAASSFKAEQLVSGRATSSYLTEKLNELTLFRRTLSTDDSKADIAAEFDCLSSPG